MHVYGRFLSIRTPTIAIATIIATVLATKYIESFDGALTIGACVGLAATVSTAKLVSADDGQYPLVPAKEA